MCLLKLGFILAFILSQCGSGCGKPISMATDPNDPSKLAIDGFIQQENWKNLCELENQLHKLKAELNDEGQKNIDETVNYLINQAGQNYKCLRHAVSTSILTTTSSTTTTESNLIENIETKENLSDPDSMKLCEDCMVDYDEIDDTRDDFEDALAETENSSSINKIIVYLVLIGIGSVLLITISIYVIILCLK